MPAHSDSTLPDTSNTALLDDVIVRAEIHPAIGIARLGTSRDAFFLAPQVVEPTPKPLGFYRDAVGALKREAAQFRIYGYNAMGQVVRELTAQNADISWSAHVANQKAAWYQWVLAMDIPEAVDVKLPRRNANLKTPEARASLVIDGGLQSVSGADAPAAEFIGSFTGTPVYLGELRTDALGRLLFLPGRGLSASPGNAPILTPGDPNNFINANGWYDDTCDGPVMAQVRIDGRAIDVKAAWIVTAPPNYAPQVKAERTLYDLMLDLYVQNGLLEPQAVISFSRDVYPILQRLSGMQWVNQGFATQYGHNGRYNFDDPAYVAQLAALPAPGAYDPNTEMRNQIVTSFRSPVQTDGNALPWPWIYGDAMESEGSQSPRQNSTISDVQYATLKRWAAGDFLSDWPPAPAPGEIDAVPLAEQPAMLTRAAMEFCLADAFHPGCEMTWPMRHQSLYSGPFRIRQRPPGVAAPDYGSELTQQQCLAADGPLHQQGPGDLTRWMGLPWQADTAYCRSGYDTSYDPYTPSFWPARVPNQVLSALDYAIVMDAQQPRARRVEAFSQRTSWNKPLHGTTSEQMEQMVRIFGSMGLLEVQPGVADDALFPAVMMVASYGPDVAPADAAETAFHAPAPAPEAGLLKGTAITAASARPLPRGANFSSHEEARNAPRPGLHRKP